MNRQDLRLPTAFLLDRRAGCVKVYRDRLDVAADLSRRGDDRGARTAERLARAVPFAGTFYSPLPRAQLPALRTRAAGSGAGRGGGRGLRAGGSGEPERVHALPPRHAPVEERRGTRARARHSSARSRCSRTSPKPATISARCWRRRGDLDGAIARFRAALAATPDYPDALNNLGYALLLTGHDAEARALYEKALALQPDFPEALNNLGLLLGRAGDLDGAERYFRDALARRADYGEAANNLALVLVARGQADAAIACSKRSSQEPGVRERLHHAREDHFKADRTRRGACRPRAPAAAQPDALPGARDSAATGLRRGQGAMMAPCAGLKPRPTCEP